MSTDDIDELITERNYFWTIAFEDEDLKLFLEWNDYNFRLVLNFDAIWEIVDEFNDFTDGQFPFDSIELFVSRRIWSNKYHRKSIYNPEFESFLANSSLSVSPLFGEFN